MEDSTRNRGERKPHDLYRFYNADDELLYVGISLNAAQRASEHKRSKPWWGDAVRMDVEKLGTITRDEAHVTERAAIEDESPIHNVTWNRQRATEQRIEYDCAVCGGSIEDGGGYLEVPGREIVRNRTETSEWERDHQLWIDDGGGFKVLNMTAALARPAPARWWTVHRDCDPALASNFYWIAIERVRTAPDILSWTAHLSEKEWLTGTNWVSFIRRTASALGGGTT